MILDPILDADIF